MDLQTVSTQIKVLGKNVVITTLFMFALSAVASVAPLEVEVVNVSHHHQLKSREFVGIINIGGLIDISAPMPGIVTEFHDKLGASVRASQKLVAIKNLDELYQDVVIKSPGDGFRIIRTYVEEGNFVQKHQRIMVLAKDIYYEAKVHLAASEVEWLKQAKSIKVLVHPNSKREQSFDIVDSRIEIPDQQNRFYNARLKLACPQKRCEDTALAGAIVKVVVKNQGDIHISREALFNNGKTVAVVNAKGMIEHRQIVKGQITDDTVVVLHGLELNERLVVRYNHPPKENEKVLVKASIVDSFAVLKPTATFE